MTCYMKLKLHLERHMYKKGVFKGDAPADMSKRAKRYFRVIDDHGRMLVRMHNANLITAYEDGRIILNTNGWHASQTTRMCMWEALHSFFMPGIHIHSARTFGMSQTALSVNGTKYKYYDGMELNANGDIISELVPFDKKIADRDERAELRRAAKESGFIGAFPVLYEMASVASSMTYVRRRSEAVCDENQAHNWPGIISDHKFPNYWARNSNTPHYPDHKAALRALMASLTKDMTVVVKSDVTVL